MSAPSKGRTKCYQHSPGRGNTLGGQHHLEVICSESTRCEFFRGRCAGSIPARERPWVKGRGKGSCPQGQPSGLEGLEHQELQWVAEGDPGKAIWTWVGETLGYKSRICVYSLVGNWETGSFWIREEHNYSNALRKLSQPQSLEHII